MRRGLAIAAGLALAASGAGAQRGVAPSSVVTGTLSFDARATLGAFTGTTAWLRGDISGGPDLSTIRGWVETMVDSLTTGNGLRNRDMRRAMESDRHPTIRFDLEEVRPSPMQGDTMIVTLVGRFTIHGTTRPASFPATLAWTAAGIHLAALLPLNVRDYGVTRLSKVLGTLRMHPEIVLRINLVVAQPPP